MARYGTTSKKLVEEQMHRLKHGGGGNHRPKNRKQAIAIGLSEARKKGAKVPRRKST